MNIRNLKNFVEMSELINNLYSLQRLLTTGPECELSKTGVYLPPFCDSHSFDLPCKPIQEGNLKILGSYLILFINVRVRSILCN